MRFLFLKTHLLTSQGVVSCVGSPMPTYTELSLLGSTGTLNGFIDPSLGNVFVSLENTATHMTLPDLHSNQVR